MDINEILIKIQSDLKAPKDQFNAFGKYKYRSCEDILEAVKPLLKQLNVSLILSDEIVNIGDRYYVKATATLINSESKTIAVTAYAREEENKKGMDSMQLTGATSSYARKYALNGLFAIDDTKDSDDLNKHGTDYDGKVTIGQVKTMEALLKKVDEGYTQRILDFNKVKSLNDLTPEQYGKAMFSIKSLLEKAK